MMLNLRVKPYFTIIQNPINKAQNIKVLVKSVSP